MKKVGLVMCYKTKNYGSMLQSFALQRFFIRKEIPFECVNYNHKKDFFDSLRKFPLLLIKSARTMKFRVMKNALMTKYFVSNDLKLKKNMRTQKFIEFCTKRFFVTDEINSRAGLIQRSKNYKCVVVGSDQVWHPINYGTHFYDLTWVDPSVPKYAYASSFGVSKVPLLIRRGVKKALKSFEKITCREKTGAKIVTELTGKSADSLLDPTLLWSSNDWDEMLALEKLRTKKEPYIFCYFLGNSPECYDFAQSLKQRTGYKIISPVLLDGYYSEALKFGDEHPFDVGPADFVWFVKNADYVLTDSFHGTVFSLLYKKKVRIFERYKDPKISANSRIMDLLKLLGISDYKLSIDELMKNDPIGLNVNQYLEKERQKAFDYLSEIAYAN